MAKLNAAEIVALDARANQMFLDWASLVECRTLEDFENARALMLTRAKAEAAKSKELIESAN